MYDFTSAILSIALSCISELFDVEYYDHKIWVTGH